MTTFSFEAIGTHWQIDIQDLLTMDQSQGLQERIHARIEEFDRAFSRFRDDSLVMRMSREAGTYPLPADGRSMFDLYQRIYHETNGAVTPLIGSLLVEAGYDAKYSLIPGELHHPSKWEDILDYKFPLLTLKQPALLDVGALGKGELIDIVGRLIEDAGCRSFCVNAGGDIFYRSATDQPLRVGLEHPQNFSQVIGVAEVRNQSLCGSAGNRRAWGEFHHIMNPHTLSSPKHILSVWTVAETTLLADAMATCLFFVPASKLLQQHLFEYVILYPDFSVEYSKGWPGEMFVSA